MLFDLRGRGRRRTVQVIYLGLALLMGGGLVLLGVGGGTDGGGILNAFTGGSGSPDTGAITDRREEVEERVKANRRDPAAWAALARARFQEASAGDSLDPDTGAYTEEGLADLREADRAWKISVELAGEGDADPNVAAIMTQVYLALNQLDDAVSAQEIVADQRNDVGSYFQLAQYAYAADQSRKADLAGQKAISLASKDQKEQIKAQVEGLKSQAAQQALQDAPGAAGATGSSGP